MSCACLLCLVTAHPEVAGKFAPQALGIDMPPRALGLCRWAITPCSPLHIVQAVGRQVIDEFAHEITAKDKSSGQCSVQVVRDGKMLECIITNPFPGSKMWLHWGFADRSR